MQGYITLIKSDFVIEMLVAKEINFFLLEHITQTAQFFHINKQNSINEVATPVQLLRRSNNGYEKFSDKKQFLIHKGFAIFKCKSLKILPSYRTIVRMVT